jgi:Protein of unknown function (DUF1566)
MKTLKTCTAAATMLLLSGAAPAALVDRGGGLIYDTTRNLTWLADMNYAYTSGYAAANAGGANADQIQATGQMGWNAAVAWADQLDFGGYSDWRLPTLKPFDPTCPIQTIAGFPLTIGFNCTGGELSGLFVSELGNKGVESVLNQDGDTAEQMANLAMFSNVKADTYWSSTQFNLRPNDLWSFDSRIGGQSIYGKFQAVYAVAVRSGDVTAAVPEPQSLALAVLALLALYMAVVARGRQPA